MSPRSSERGFLTFSGTLMLLVLAGIGFAAFKLLPPYIGNYRLQQYMQTLARQATYNAEIAESAIQGQVINEAQQLGIGLEPRQVVVRKDSLSVAISVQYDVPVNLLVRQLDLQFAPFAVNRSVMAP